MYNLISFSYSNSTLVKNLKNNIISGITIEAPYYEDNFYYVNTNAVFDTISNNIVGSENQINSISLNLNTTATRNTCTLFNVFSPMKSSLSVFRDNIEQNISRGTGASAMNGIYFYNKINIFNNKISNISTISGEITGAACSNSSGNPNINNCIFSNFSTSGNVNGIKLYSNNSTVSSNYITSLSSSSNSNIYGIYCMYSNNFTCFNNIVELGTLENGNSINLPNIYGIYATDGKIYYNTVRINGNHTSNNSSYAYYSNISSNSRDIKNNLFINNRTNTSGTGKHYAIYITGLTSLTSNYNNFYASGTGGILGFYNYYDRLTIDNWKTATGNDANSSAINPSFLESLTTGYNEITSAFFPIRNIYKWL